MASSEKIKVGIVDDQQFVIDGFARMIEAQPDMKLMMQATSVPLVLHKFSPGSLDVLLLDFSLPPKNPEAERMDGDKLLPLLLEKDPDLKVLMLSMYNEAYLVNKMMSLGARGFEPKNAGEKSTLTAIRNIAATGWHNNDIVFHAMRRAAETTRKATHRTGRAALLKEEHITCLRHWKAGCTVEQTAGAMQRSKAAVKKYRAAIRNITGLQDSAEIFSWARERGITPIG